MRSFPGGLEFARGRPVRLSPVPETVAAHPVRVQLIGRPEVQAGQIVRAGQVLREARRADEPSQTAPIAGTVRGIEMLEAEGPGSSGGAGAEGPCGPVYEIIIEPAGPRVETALDVAPPRGRTLDSWLAALRQVGMASACAGGVGLVPQLSAAQSRKVDTVICVGTDPFPPFADRSSLLVSFPDDAVLGTMVLADLVGAKRSRMVASELPAIARRLKPSCQTYRLALETIDAIYPAADPTLALWSHASGRRRLPFGANPVSEGVMLVHPWTAIRVGRWFTLRKFDLILPVFFASAETGAELSWAYAIPGQPIASIDPQLERALVEKPPGLLLGHPLTGKRLEHAGPTSPTPVLPDGEVMFTILPPNATAAEQACVSCGWCAEVCPTALRPVHLLESIRRGEEEKLADALRWCVECGLCSYVCPSSIPLAQGLREGKVKLNGPMNAQENNGR